VEVQLYEILPFELHTGEKSASHPGYFMPSQSVPLIHSMGGWSGHFGDEKNLLPLLGIEP